MSNGLFVTFPVAGYSTKNITSFFGKRDTSKLPDGASSYHEGIDIAAPAERAYLLRFPARSATPETAAQR